MAADFSALGAKGGNNVAVGHAQNLGADPVHFLWQLRHNTGRNREFSRPNRELDLGSNFLTVHRYPTKFPLTQSRSFEQRHRGRLRPPVRDRSWRRRAAPIDWLANIVQPRSFDDLAKHGFGDPPGSTLDCNRPLA